MDATPTHLLTADEYLLLDTDRRTELVRGHVVPLEWNTPRHGYRCTTLVYLLCFDQEDRRTGHLVCNNAGVVTERDPDTARGPDVSYYSYQRVPRGPLPYTYLDVAPELVFEVRSSTDRWADLYLRIGEFLRAGVLTVSVLDDETEAIHLFTSNGSPQVLTGDQELTFPGILEHFRIPARRFFEFE